MLLPFQKKKKHFWEKICKLFTWSKETSYSSIWFSFVYSLPMFFLLRFQVFCVNLCCFYADITMHGQLIVYDNVNQKIGWIESDCMKPWSSKSFSFFWDAELLSLQKKNVCWLSPINNYILVFLTTPVLVFDSCSSLCSNNEKWWYVKGMVDTW